MGTRAELIEHAAQPGPARGLYGLANQGTQDTCADTTWEQRAPPPKQQQVSAMWEVAKKNP